MGRAVTLAQSQHFSTSQDNRLEINALIIARRLFGPRLRLLMIRIL
jgi:hypothetical protein